jgi:hypothetical protein
MAIAEAMDLAMFRGNQIEKAARMPARNKKFYHTANQPFKARD